jgi:hypothetical protein
LCREPSTGELRLIAEFVSQQTAHLQQHPEHLPKGVSASKQVVTNLCHVLMSSNEFLYID